MPMCHKIVFQFGHLQSLAIYACTKTHSLFCKEFAVGMLNTIPGTLNFRVLNDESQLRQETRRNHT